MNIIYYLGAAAAVAVVFLLVIFAFRKSGRENADEMTGVEFEQYAARLLSENGIQILEETRVTGDFGADFVIMLNGERTVLQCKRYARPIGVKAVQEALAAMPYYKCSKAAVITNSTFTRQARELAEESGTILWDCSDVEEFERCAESGAKRREYGTLKLCRLEDGAFGDEAIYLCAGSERFMLEPHVCTAVTLPCGRTRLVLRAGSHKAALRVSVCREARSFAAGFVGKKLFLGEIASK